MSKRRVVVTGMGTVSPVGIGVDNFWNALINGKSGVSPITNFDATGLPTLFSAYCNDYDPLEHFSSKEARTLSRFIQLAVVAAREARKNANLETLEGVDVDPFKVGVVLGSGIGCIQTAEEEYAKAVEKGPTRISPFFIPKMIVNEAAGQVSIESGAKGMVTCTVTACASGTNCIGDALRFIQYGDADIIIAGGTEAATSLLGIGGFCAAKALSRNNENPQGASRPFDANRDGFVMGEGAGVLILEELETAKGRGAPILAELVGYGRTGDAYHATAPESSGVGAAKAMEFALADAGVKPEDIDYINAHGTSTKLNDMIETRAIKITFGEAANKVAVSSTKSMTGHLLGAAGAIEAIACVKALQNNKVPPTINYETPDEELDLDYVPNTARDMDVNFAMSNSLGFGGHNASIVFKKYEE